MNKAILWMGDPLWKLKSDHRVIVYTLLAVYFCRLAIWYGVEERWGRP